MLFNESIKSGIFPNALKIARITPIFKGGNNSPNSYRPISNLHKISKIFEKITYDRLMSFLQKFEILSPKQFSYRKNHSTIDALNLILNYIYSGLNNSETIIAILLDLSKAYDTVQTEILLAKLCHYSIRGKELKWFSCYLSNR